MRANAWTLLAGIVIIGGGLALGSGSAIAQEPGLGGILGGYGAMAGSGSSMGGGFNVVDPSGMGGGVVAAAAGGSGASMSAGMKGGGLAFQPRAATRLYERSSFTLDSMGGSNRMAGGMGGRRAFTLEPSSLTGGIGLGGMRRMPGAGRMGVMPPSIGYPFRQPLSPLSPTSTGAGMSM